MSRIDLRTLPLLAALALGPGAALAEDKVSAPVPKSGADAMESSYRSIINLLEDEIASLEARITVLTTERRRELSRLEQTREETARAERRLAEVRSAQTGMEQAVRAGSPASLSASAQRTAPATSRDQNAAATSLAKAEAERARLEDVAARLDRETKAASKQLEKLALAVAEREETLKGLTERTGALEKSAAARGADLSALETRQSQLLEAIADRESTLKELDAEVAERQSVVRTAETRAAEVSKAVAESEARLVDLRMRLEKADAAFRTRETDVAALEARRAELGKDLTALDERRQAAEKAAVEVEDRLALMRKNEHDQVAAFEAGRGEDAARAKAVRDQVTVQEEILSSLKQNIRILSQERANKKESLSAEVAALAERLDGLRKAEADARAEADAASRQAQAQAHSEALAHLAETRRQQEAEIRKLSQKINDKMDELQAISEEEAVLERPAVAAVQEKAARPADPVPVAPPAQGAAAAPRPAELVAGALLLAPGIPGPGSSERERLESLLVDGACPLDALRDALGTVNRQTLVALIRTLGGC